VPIAVNDMMTNSRESICEQRLMVLSEMMEDTGVTRRGEGGGTAPGDTRQGATIDLKIYG